MLPDRWPTGHGFDYFYGFFAGETSQWEPRLYENLNPVEPPPALARRGRPHRRRHRSRPHHGQGHRSGCLHCERNLRGGGLTSVRLSSKALIEESLDKVFHSLNQYLYIGVGTGCPFFDEGLRDSKKSKTFDRRTAYGRSRIF